MPADYYFGYYFFAPRDRFAPCGMFTASHIVATIICIAVIIVCLLLYNNKFRYYPQFKLYRAFAIILTFFEAIKISHSFIYGDYYLDAWFPLSYCGLLIFALWIAGYGKGTIKRSAEHFIAYGCPIAGIAFLISPSTSLMMFPVWHYFSVYSMFYHSLMIFLGVQTLKFSQKLNLRNYIECNAFVLVFCFMAISINSIFDSNLMLLRMPFNIPVKFLTIVYNSHPFAYTVVALTSYMIIPVLTSFFANLIRKITS